MPLSAEDFHRLLENLLPVLQEIEAGYSNSFFDLFPNHHRHLKDKRISLRKNRSGITILSICPLSKQKFPLRLHRSILPEDPDWTLVLFHSDEAAADAFEFRCFLRILFLRLFIVPG